jgi:hypothetical protein
LNFADDPRTKALIGSAFIALVETGANAQAVAGASLAFANKVKEILGTHDQGLVSVELTPAVQAVIQETVARTVAASDQARGRVKKEPKKVRVNVNIFGKRTSVALPSTMVATLAQLKGSQSEAKLVVQEIANRLPDAVTNRSEWVDEQLHHYLLLNQGGIDEVSRH